MRKRAGPRGDIDRDARRDLVRVEHGERDVDVAIAARREHDAARARPVLAGAAVAVSRALIVILENYQRSDGLIDVPLALRPYLGKDVIGRR